MDETFAVLKRFSVLFVEDEEGIRTRILNALSYYVKAAYGAQDAKEGLEVYEEHHPDVVISDIHMPHGGGIALVKALRQRDAHLPIVMLSAYSREEYFVELINLKIDHFILKPANAQRLLEGIVAALGERLNGCVVLKEGIVFCPKERTLYHEGRMIALSKRENTFLELLHRNARRTTTYAMIEEALWEEKYMSMEALKTFIKELRKKVTIELIENLPQEGYRLKI